MNVDDTGRDEEDIVLWFQRHLDDDHDVDDDDDDFDDDNDGVDDIEEPSWLLQWSAGGACTVGGGTGEPGPSATIFFNIEY